MKNREYRKCSGLEFRSDKGLKLVGYAAVFNRLSEDLGGFREVIRPGAFRETIASGADVRFLVNHDGLPLARTSSGTLRIAEDARGLHIEADMDENDPDVQRLLPKIRRGDVAEMSFGFSATKDAWRKEGEHDIRELHQVELFDVSAVAFPAYKATEVALRSLAAHRAQVGDDGEAYKARIRYFVALSKSS